MLLETKFNVGDQRWIMLNDKPTLVTITKIELEIDEDNQIYIFYYIKHVAYYVNSSSCCRRRSESSMLDESFSTKQELINSL